MFICDITSRFVIGDRHLLSPHQLVEINNYGSSLKEEERYSSEVVDTRPSADNISCSALMGIKVKRGGKYSVIKSSVGRSRGPFASSYMEACAINPTVI